MTKTEHEKLKEICDKIRYDNKNFKFAKEGKTWPIQLYKNFTVGNQWTCADVREIIFTQEFMDRCIGKIDLKLTLSDICKATHYHKLEVFKNELFKNLDEPVDYLYKTIKDD